MELQQHLLLLTILQSKKVNKSLKLRKETGLGLEKVPLKHGFFVIALKSSCKMSVNLKKK